MVMLLAYCSAGGPERRFPFGVSFDPLPASRVRRAGEIPPRRDTTKTDTTRARPKWNANASRCIIIAGDANEFSKRKSKTASPKS